MSKKYFINHLDTLLGQEFYQFLSKDLEEGVHMATYIDQERVDVPKGFKKILKKYKPKLSRKKMLEECDVYIYDLETATQEDIQFVYNIFSSPTLTLEEQKTLIVISNVMTWSATQKKIKPKDVKPPDDVQDDGGEKPVDEPPVEPQDQPQQTEGNEQQQEPEQQQKIEDVQDEIIEYTYWEEQDYKSRQAIESYQLMKENEDKLLSLQKDNLKVIVVCGGLKYGKGEQLFQKHFKQAWLQNPYKLSYLAEEINKQGENLMPTIHILDLVKMIIKVSETPPEGNYIFAIDNTQNKSQKSIIEGIAKGVGSGWIDSDSEFFKDFDEADLAYFRFLNLDARPSKLFIGDAENPADFEWHCQAGVAENAQKLLQEFNTAHNHRPLKLIMYCNSEGMRFETILHMISIHYRIPIITSEQILKDAQDANFTFPKELLEDFQEYLEFLTEQFQNNKKQDLSEQMKIFYKIVKWRLSQNDCKNRGYILKNFPINPEDCDLIFYPNKQKLKMKKKPKKKPIKPVDEPKQDGEPAQDPDPNADPDADPNPDAQDPPVDGDAVANQEPVEEPVEEIEEQQDDQQEEEEGGPKPEVFMPESIVIVKPFDKIDKTSYNQQINKFFNDKDIDIYFLDSRLKNNPDVFENLRIFVERNGQPNNYLKQEAQLVTRYVAYQNLKNLAIKRARKDALKCWRNLVFDKKVSRKDLAQKHIKLIDDQEQELEKVIKFPFRNYLIEYVVPILNEGLVEVAQTLPDDPVEFLAEYLYKKSFEAKK